MRYQTILKLNCFKSTVSMNLRRWNLEIGINVTIVQLGGNVVIAHLVPSELPKLLVALLQTAVLARIGVSPGVAHPHVCGKYEMNIVPSGGYLQNISNYRSRDRPACKPAPCRSDSAPSRTMSRAGRAAGTPPAWMSSSNISASYSSSRWAGFR